MMSKNIIKIFTIIIISMVVYILLLLLSYKKKNIQYKYSDLNNNQLTSSYFERKILERLPIIIWHNDFNIDLDTCLNIVSPGLSIRKYFLPDFNNTGVLTYHNTDRLFVIAKTKVTIQLYSPSIYYDTEQIPRTISNKNLFFNSIKNNKKLDNIEIELQPKDILYIPRYWYFNVNKQNAVDLCIYDSIISKFCTFFV